jgi:drug/metabolite transporter (DMT)-like permease
MNRVYIGTLAMLVGAASYGVSGPFAKLALRNGLSLGELVDSMFFVSSIIFSVILMFNSHRFDGLTQKGIWQLAGVGAVGLGGTVIFYYYAISQLPVSVAIVLLFQFAWIVPFINIIIHRKWPNIYVLLALILVIAGTLIAVELNWNIWRQGTWVGYIAGFISAWCYSAFLFFNAHIATKVPALTRSAFMSISGLIVVIVIHPPTFLFNGRLFELGVWPLVTGVLCQVFPTLLMAVGIPIIGGILSGILGAIELPVSVLSSNIILHEPISKAKWLGIALILFGISIASAWGDRERKLGMKRKSKLPSSTTI